MELELIWSAIKTHGWQAMVVAAFTLLMVEILKLPARKLIKNETARHGFYILLNIGFTALAVFVINTWIPALQWSEKTFVGMYGASIAIVNSLYPLVAITGLWGLIEKILGKIGEGKAPETPIGDGKALDATGKVVELAKPVSKS